MTHYIIEGLDRLGKDTLIDGILNQEGFHQVIHYSKPKKLACYKSDLQAYQYLSFVNMFTLLREAKGVDLIFNRAHLGEVVYSPLYRGYEGEYVFMLEEAFKVKKLHHIKLILL